jgi:hypothetical protein
MTTKITFCSTFPTNRTKLRSTTSPTSTIEVSFYFFNFILELAADMCKEASSPNLKLSKMDSRSPSPLKLNKLQSSSPTNKSPMAVKASAPLISPRSSQEGQDEPEANEF